MISGQKSFSLKYLSRNPITLQFLGISKVISDGSSNGAIIQEKDNQSRFRWFSCAIPALNVDESLQNLMQQIKNGTLQERIVVEGAPVNGSECSLQNNNLSIDIIQSDSIYIKVHVVSDKAGWLMQLAANYPGWVAKIDGQEVPLFYGDILFRTLYLPSGEHTVEYFYKPMSFQAGLIISLCFIFVSIIYVFIRRQYKE